MRFEGGLFAFSQVQSQQEGLIFLNYYNFDPFRITFPNYSHEFLCRSSYLNSRSAWCYQREHTGVSINLFSTVNRKVCSFVFTCKALLQDTKTFLIFKYYDHSQDYQNHITHFLLYQMKRHWKTRIYVDLAAKRGGSLPIALVFVRFTF